MRQGRSRALGRGGSRFRRGRRGLNRRGRWYRYGGSGHKPGQQRLLVRYRNGGGRRSNYRRGGGRRGLRRSCWRGREWRRWLGWYWSNRSWRRAAGRGKIYDRDYYRSNNSLSCHHRTRHHRRR
ncbi:hypothetical protein GCM10022408_23200 [Hymenobacter fastidiosus]|uniref:Uncharacterized protein n=1 Tax=Hymenobacter fastidiosus TaxID=486264 RepID=A0ABP7SDG0_9BACT